MMMLLVECGAWRYTRPSGIPTLVSGVATPVHVFSHREHSPCKLLGGQAPRYATRELIITMALFVPRVASKMIAAFFPEAWHVRRYEFDVLDPLGALPRIQLRNHPANRTAMLYGDWLTVMRNGQQRVVREKVTERQVCRPTVIVGMANDEICCGFYASSTE